LEPGPPGDPNGEPFERRDAILAYAQEQDAGLSGRFFLFGRQGFRKLPDGVFEDLEFLAQRAGAVPPQERSFPFDQLAPKAIDSLERGPKSIR
jgi:hypothetical protein